MTAEPAQKLPSQGAQDYQVPVIGHSMRMHARPGTCHASVRRRRVNQDASLAEVSAFRNGPSRRCTPDRHMCSSIATGAPPALSNRPPRVPKVFPAESENSKLPASEHARGRTAAERLSQGWERTLTWRAVDSGVLAAVDSVVSGAVRHPQRRFDSNWESPCHAGKR